MVTAVIHPTLLPQKRDLLPKEEDSICSSLAQKISRFITAVFGYFLRICFFMLGEIKTCGASFVMRFYQRCTSEKADPIDPARIARSKEILQDMGGKEYVVKAQDGLADIHYMLFTYENFRSKVYEKGGSIQDLPAFKSLGFYQELNSSPTKTRLLFPPAIPTASWNQFEKALLKMDWPKTEIKRLNGQKQTCFILSDVPGASSDSCVINVHTARRSFAMDRKHVSKHLGAGVSTCIYDPRGTADSTGVASEGGYYLDGKAVLESLSQNHGFSIPKIWVTGFCGGAVVAAYLKKEYHEQGINVLLENGFTSLETTVKNQPFPASMIGRIGLDAVKSVEPETTSRVEQDHFNNVKKLESLSPHFPSQGGITIVSYSIGDTTLAPEDGAKLAAAAQKIGKTYTFVKNAPADKDAHSYDFHEEPHLWKRYLQLIRSGS